MPGKLIQMIVGLFVLCVSHPSLAATIDKKFLQKKVMVVLLDENEIKIVKVGSELLVQEDNTQPDILIEADVVYLMGNQALLSAPMMGEEPGTGKKIHLFVKPPLTHRRAIDDSSEVKATENMPIPEKTKEMKLDEKLTVLDDSMNDTFGNLDDFYANKKGQLPEETIDEGKSIVVLKVFKPREKSNDPLKIEACNKSGLHIDKAAITLALTNQGKTVESQVSIAKLNNSDCITFSIPGMDPKLLTPSLKVSVKKAIYDQGALKIDTNVVDAPLELPVTE